MCRNNCNLVTGSFTLRSQDTSPEKSNLFFYKDSYFQDFITDSFSEDILPRQPGSLSGLDACLALASRSEGPQKQLTFFSPEGAVITRQMKKDSKSHC
jgi:hypothetical protein